MLEASLNSCSSDYRMDSDEGGEWDRRRRQRNKQRRLRRRSASAHKGELAEERVSMLRRRSLSRLSKRGKKEAEEDDQDRTDVARKDRNMFI